MKISVPSAVTMDGRSSATTIHKSRVQISRYVFCAGIGCNKKAGAEKYWQNMPVNISQRLRLNKAAV